MLAYNVPAYLVPKWLNLKYPLPSTGGGAMVYDCLVLFKQISSVTCRDISNVCGCWEISSVMVSMIWWYYSSANVIVRLWRRYFAPSWSSHDSHHMTHWLHICTSTLCLYSLDRCIEITCACMTACNWMTCQTFSTPFSTLQHNGCVWRCLHFMWLCGGRMFFSRIKSASCKYCWYSELPVCDVWSSTFCHRSVLFYWQL